jgi:hypothetical protein
MFKADELEKELGQEQVCLDQLMLRLNSLNQLEVDAGKHAPTDAQALMSLVATDREKCTVQIAAVKARIERLQHQLTRVQATSLTEIRVAVHIHTRNALERLLLLNEERLFEHLQRMLTCSDACAIHQLLQTVNQACQKVEEGKL